MLKSLIYRSLDNTRVVYITRDREDGAPTTWSIARHELQGGDWHATAADTFPRLTSAQAAARLFVKGKGGRRRRGRQLSLFVDDPPRPSTGRGDRGAVDDPPADGGARRTRGGRRTGDRNRGGGSTRAGASVVPATAGAG